MQNIAFAAKIHRIYPGYVKCDLFFLVFRTCIEINGMFNQARQTFQSTK